MEATITTITNVSSVSSESLLYDLNEEKARLFIPVMIVIGLLMTTGVMGNVLVCLFYGLKVRNTPSKCFILCLATYDLISCILSMPMEIVELRYFYNYPDVLLCKAMRFVNYFSSLGSGCLLIFIAVDRYRKICLPFNKQISVHHIKMVIVFSVFFTLVFSGPSLYIYNVLEVQLETGTGYVSVFDCTTISDSLFVFVYNIILVLLFISSICILTVIYIQVGRKIKIHRKFRSSEFVKYSRNEDSGIFHTSSRLTSIPSSLNKLSPLTEVTESNQEESRSNSSKTDHSPNCYSNDAYIGDDVTVVSHANLYLLQNEGEKQSADSQHCEKQTTVATVANRNVTSSQTCNILCCEAVMENTKTSLITTTTQSAQEHSNLFFEQLSRNNEENCKTDEVCRQTLNIFTFDISKEVETTDNRCSSDVTKEILNDENRNEHAGNDDHEIDTVNVFDNLQGVDESQNAKDIEQAEIGKGDIPSDSDCQSVDSETDDTFQQGTELEIVCNSAMEKYRQPETIHTTLSQNNGFSKQLNAKLTEYSTVSKKKVYPHHINMRMLNSDSSYANSVRKRQSQRINSRKYTAISFSITLAFVLSFLPYLCLSIWRSIMNVYEANVMNNAALIAFEIFMRSFMINSAVNPLIYGFFNSQFKDFVYSSLKHVFWCSPRH